MFFIILYVVFTIPEIFEDESKDWLDYHMTKRAIDQFPDVKLGGSIKFIYVKNSILYTSQAVFGNDRVLPFAGSIALLLLTYFFTYRISTKRFGGIIAFLILLQSDLFLRYDTYATYSNFWVLFYILSLYLFYKRYWLSPISYIASILSKPLSLLFLPLSLFYVFNSDIPKKRKKILVISYIIIFIFVIVAYPLIETPNRLQSFDVIEFISGFTAFAYQLRFDGLILVFILPLCVALYYKAQKGLREANSILILMIGVLLSAPLLAGFTIYDIQPYRYMPMVVFFAMGVGILFRKTNDLLQ